MYCSVLFIWLMLSCLKGHDITSIADNVSPTFYMFIHDNRIKKFNKSSLYYYIKNSMQKNLFLMDFDLIDFLRNRKYGDIEI